MWPSVPAFKVRQGPDIGWLGADWLRFLKHKQEMNAQGSDTRPSRECEKKRLTIDYYLVTSV